MPQKNNVKPTSAKFIPPAEVAALLNAPLDAGAVRDHHLLACMFYLALRVGECVLLQPNHFDLDHQCVRVPSLKKRKKDKATGAPVVPLIEVPVFPEAAAPLAAVAAWAHGRPWVFQGQKFGTHITVRAVLNRFVFWTNSLGLDPAYTPHSLRHSACSMIMQQTKNPVLVRDFARHGSIATTDVYLHGGPQKWTPAAGSLVLAP